MYNFSNLIPNSQFDTLLELLPTPRYKGTGRPLCEKEALLKGILQVLCLDIPWKKMFPCGASPSSCYRYYQELQKRGDLKLRFKQLADKKTDTTECAADTDSTTSFSFKRGTGWDDPSAD